MLGNPIPNGVSHHGGKLVYEVIDGVDNELDVIFLSHAVLAVAPQNDVHVRAQHTLSYLHGDVPGHVLIFQAVNETYGAGDRDGAL